MKLSIIAAVVAFITSPAVFAGGSIQPGDSWAGHGAAASQSGGFAGAISSVYGSGASFQGSFSASGGSAGLTFESDFAQHNLDVSTHAEQYAMSGSIGATLGNAPTFRGGQLANGTQASGTSENSAWTNGSFDSIASFGGNGHGDGNNGHGNDDDGWDDSNPGHGWE